MAIGQGAIVAFPSYLALTRETTFGTYATGTSGVDFLSCSIKTMQEAKILEEISTRRVYSDQILTSKKVEGDLELYYDPKNVASNLLVQNAFGGAAVTSATATGETAGGTAFTHTVVLGNFDTGAASLSANMRKGDSASAKIFEFSGIRVNEFSLSAEIDDAVKMNFSLIAKDSSTTSNDVSTSVGMINTSPLSFVNGRLSLETTFAALTTTSFWHIQNVELTINNNLKSDSESRRIGSNVLQVLPPGPAIIEMTFSVRYDTTTAYNAMLAGTQYSAELEFLGDTLTTSIIRQGIKLQMPKIFIQEASDPEVGGPDEVLVQEIKAVVLQDSSSASGYAIRALITNLASSI